MARFGRGLPGGVLDLDPPVSLVVTIADKRVTELFSLPWLPAGGPPGTDAMLVEPGEASKSLEEWSRLTDHLVRLGADRDVLIVAFGGGVVLDLAGFVAATYLRGVRWVALPTTLLAQVDAAHGGKTGVNHPAAKNLVGAFHRPTKVIADFDWLATLPDAEVRNGLAEVVKHAVLAAPTLLERVGRDRPAEFVQEAALVKIDIVARDPLETGERRLLNLGHTMGHALERASEYALSHGEAVALGLRAACRIAESHCGFQDRARVEEALDRCGLPRTALLQADAVLARLGHDKKRRGDTLRWVLPHALGDVRVHEDVSHALVRDALDAVLT